MAEGLHALMTRTTLTRFKVTLRDQLPQLRSSHADEVIAAGMGYRTHAALLAAFGDAREINVVIDMERAKTRLAELCPTADASLVGAALDDFIHGSMHAVLEAQRRRMAAAIANDN